MKSQNKQKTGKTKALMIGATVVIVIAVGGFVFEKNKENKNIKAVQTEVNVSTNKINKLNEKMTALYSKDFFKENMKEETFKTLTKDAKNVVNVDFKKVDQTKLDLTDYENSKQKLATNVEKVTFTYDGTKAINDLFVALNDQEAIMGTKVNESLAIKDDVNNEKVKTVKTKFYVTKNANDFNKTLNKLIDNADGQVKQIDVASKEVAKVYKDNKVISTDKTLYDKAVDEVNKIKNETKKKELTNSLNKVKGDIDKKEADEKKQSEATPNTTNDNTSNTQSQQNNETNSNNNSENNQNSNAGANATNDNNYTGGGNTGGDYTSGGSTGGGNTGGGNTGGGNTGGGSTGGGSTGGGNTGGGSTGGGNTGGGSTGGGPVTPPAATRYMGYWDDGATIHSAGIFNTEAEALAAGKAMYVANGRVGSWGSQEV